MQVFCYLSSDIFYLGYCRLAIGYSALPQCKLFNARCSMLNETDKVKDKVKDKVRASGVGRELVKPVGLWTAPLRCLVFLLAASSIACLLSDFYHLCPMRLFTPFIFLPSLLALVALALFDRLSGDGHLSRAVFIGLGAGLLAAVAYDLFRLPFVFAKGLGITAFVTPMNLFKVFPRFGAMILGQPTEQPSYSLTAQLLGWAYHFSNGATFGVMYIAMIGNPARRHWSWAILMAVTLELGMLFTPYPQVFGIQVIGHFIAVTAAAHAIFGLALGLAVRRLWV
ncbi:MAG: hypothetical protein C5B50_26995 [Verrucomicrobia bacterium]|nr:MAG: hypothetical protein C5B50_26995 [Verrucomicrobiota bacterium]